MAETDQAYRATHNDAGGLDWRVPPRTAVALDADHALSWIWWSAMAMAHNRTSTDVDEWWDASEQPDRVWVGFDEWHRRADGTWCVGYCLIDVPAANEWAAAYVGGQTRRWQVVSRSPLTLTPSLACKVCPSHGFITNGRWVVA